MTMAARAASKDQITRNIKKGEFFLSKTEFKKFGLRKSQANNLRQIIFDLIFFKIIKKSDNRKGNKNATIYSFISTDFIDCTRRYDNRTDNRLTTDCQQTDNRLTQTKSIKNNKSSKKEKEGASDFEKALADFREMRRKIKKPMTSKAEQLLLGKLSRLSDNEGEKIKILEQSIFHNWQGVFELKHQDIEIDWGQMKDDKARIDYCRANPKILESLRKYKKSLAQVAETVITHHE